MTVITTLWGYLSSTQKLVQIFITYIYLNVMCVSDGRWELRCVYACVWKGNTAGVLVCSTLLVAPSDYLSLEGLVRRTLAGSSTHPQNLLIDKWFLRLKIIL